MGAIGGLLGTAGGVNGTGISGPSSLPINSPVTGAQVDTANAGVGSSLDSTSKLLAALQGQRGAQNQSQVYNQGQSMASNLAANNGTGIQANATGQQQGLNAGLTGLNGMGAQGAAMGQQGGLNSQLGGAGGVGAQQGAISGLQNVLAQQQGLANQYQGVANGTGPNPAQAMLNQQTGNNIANQAALMAGQRGAGSNVGLMARQAAQQGAATQQQAVGQGATMQAQQQLNAMAGLAAQQQAMGGTNQNIGGLGAGLVGQQQAGINNQYNQGAGAVNQLQTGIGQQFGQGAQTIGQQQNQQGINAGIAQNQVQNQMGANNQVLQGNIANAGQQMGAMGNYNTNMVNMQGGINSANAGLAASSMKGQQGMIGGILQGAGAALAVADGGYISHMADGGMPGPYAAPQGQGAVMVTPPPPMPSLMPPMAAAPPPGPTSSFGQFLAGTKDTGDFATSPPIQAVDQDPKDKDKGQQAQMSFTDDTPLSKGASALGNYGMTQAMQAMAAKGGMAHDYRVGGTVKAKNPQEKAVKKGDSYDNDKIKAVLSEGEIVIPRSVIHSKDPVRGSADFVAKVLAKRGKK